MCLEYSRTLLCHNHIFESRILKNMTIVALSVAYHVTHLLQKHRPELCSHVALLECTRVQTESSRPFCCPSGFINGFFYSQIDYYSGKGIVSTHLNRKPTCFHKCMNLWVLLWQAGHVTVVDRHIPSVVDVVMWKTPWQHLMYASKVQYPVAFSACVNHVQY